eukprot:CAMPEP_0205809622 /NCGR_PEP_ID=MMETSP0205-20121125/13876_1 /ASSEMBLY_ACC=CAM_ASM_000278 /TAXON_ID=36767 /ORGANISM="Euplotes focardii, Strain TN1" /LENGTH=269 /DNA_ID=CAMNT_0053087085 /DNA_START=377 /DNA_END=1183 /DNA_ORIENTATION=+
MDLVTGHDQTADFGNKKNISGIGFNPIHWAVYTNNLHAIKTIIENQIFNIVITGKVPTNTGMANESEVSIEQTNDADFENDVVNLNSNGREPPHSEKRFGSIPRSLLLFWPIDQEHEDIFNYLWNELEINWGLKTLKFILTMICIKENHHLLESFLLSNTFEKIINSLPFHDSMDFLEPFIIKNERIPEEMKVDLFDRQNMIVYDFVGELMCLENKEASVADNSKYKEKLREEDYERIRSSEKAMAKISELKKYVSYIEDSDEQEEIYE